MWTKKLDKTWGNCESLAGPNLATNRVEVWLCTAAP